MFSSRRRIVLFVVAAAVLFGVAVGIADGAEADNSVSAPSVGAPSVQEQGGKRLAVKLSAGAAELVNVVAFGRVVHRGKRFPLRRVEASVAPLQEATLKLRLRKDKHERKVMRALRKGRTRTASVTVKLIDLAGNSAKRKLQITLT